MKLRYIILGIRDYRKDVWHDFLVYRLFKIYKRAMYFDNGSMTPIVEWKEGSVWHYIKQRQIAMERKDGHKDTRKMA